MSKLEKGEFEQAPEEGRRQLFNEGDVVHVFRTSGRLDDGWEVEAKIQKTRGNQYKIGKEENGQPVHKIVFESNLIEAKIAALNLRRDGITDMGDITEPDRGVLERIDAEIALLKQEKLQAVEAERQE